MTRLRLTLAAAAAAIAIAAAPASALERATVARVVDGDTIHVTLDGQDQTVRILAINTPETVAPGRPVECGGPEASAATKSLLPVGAQVRLIPDAEQGNTDRYGRLLRYVRITRPGYDDVGYELVRRGWARVYRGRYETRLTPRYLRVEAVAQRHHRGIWGKCGGS